MSTHEDPDIDHQAKLIVARKRFWTRDTEKLLRKWKTQVRQRYMGHKLSERKYTKIYYGIGLPMTILSSTSASGILTTFQNCDSCGVPLYGNGTSILISSKCDNDAYIRLAMGLVGIIAAILSALFLFIDAGGVRKDHKDAAGDCDSLSRDIEEILIQPIVQRGDPIAQLQRIRNRFDIIVQNSPSIPSLYQKNLEYTSIGTLAAQPEFSVEKHGHHVSLKPPRSDIDITKIRRKGKIPDTSVLAEILSKQVRDTEEKVAEERAKIEKINDHDTDEEHDVAIQFDPDCFRPDDIPDDPIKQSLQRALEFELFRFGGGQDTAIDIHDESEAIAESIAEGKMKEEECFDNL